MTAGQYWLHRMKYFFYINGSSLCSEWQNCEYNPLIFINESCFYSLTDKENVNYSPFSNSVSLSKFW